MRDLRAAADLNAMDPFTDEPKPRKRSRTTTSSRAQAKPRGAQQESISQLQGDEGAWAAHQELNDDAPSDDDADAGARGMLLAAEADIAEELSEFADKSLLELSAGVLMDVHVEGGDQAGGIDLADDGEAPFDIAPQESDMRAEEGPSSSSSAQVALGIAGARAGQGAAGDAVAAVNMVIEDLVVAAGVAATEPGVASSSAADMPPAADSETSPALALGKPAISILSVGEVVPGGPPGWTKSLAGYVYDSERRCRGRITSWGRDGSNIGVRAVGGKSHAVKRDWATDGQLLQWLHSGFAAEFRPQPPQPQSQPSS